MRVYGTMPHLCEFKCSGDKYQVIAKVVANICGGVIAAIADLGKKATRLTNRLRGDALVPQPAFLAVSRARLASRSDYVLAASGNKHRQRWRILVTKVVIKSVETCYQGREIGPRQGKNTS